MDANEKGSRYDELVAENLAWVNRPGNRWNPHRKENLPGQAEKRFPKIHSFKRGQLIREEGENMINDVVSFFHKGDRLVLVFNFPTGFCPLAQMLEIDSSQWVAKSEVLFVVSKPITAEKEIDCGEIINAHLDTVAGMKVWTESYLNQPWQAVLTHIMQIQELQLKKYEHEMQLLKYLHTHKSGSVKPLIRQVYYLEEKINRIKHAATVLQNTIAGPIQ
jgi:hypothetical protein